MFLFIVLIPALDLSFYNSKIDDNSTMAASMLEEPAQSAKISAGPRTTQRAHERRRVVVNSSLVQVTALISTSPISNIEAAIFSHSPIISNNNELNFTFH